MVDVHVREVEVTSLFRDGDDVVASRELFEVSEQRLGESDRYRLTGPRLTADGVVIVHGDAPGYRAVGRFTVDATAVIGHRPYVITDDGPGGQQRAEPL